MPCAELGSGGDRGGGVVGDFAQYLRDSFKLTRLVQEVAYTKRPGRTLILRQRVVGEHNRNGFTGLKGQGAQDTEARALSQVQIENDDVNRLRVCEGDRGVFVVDSAYKIDAGNVVQQFTQAIRKDGGVLDE